MGFRSGSGTVAASRARCGFSGGVSVAFAGTLATPPPRQRNSICSSTLKNCLTLLDRLVVQMVLDPIWAVLERRLHVAGEQLLPLDLQIGAALLVERLGDGGRTAPARRRRRENQTLPKLAGAAARIVLRLPVPE